MHYLNTFNVTSEDNGACIGNGLINTLDRKVLILHGDKDCFVPLKDVELSLKYFGENATIKKFENCGHGIHMDEEDAVVESIKEFLL